MHLPDPLHDPGGRGLFERMAGEPLDYTMSFDFSGVLPVNFFDVTLFPAPLDGFPIIINQVRVFFATPMMAAVWRFGLRQNGRAPDGANDAVWNTGNNDATQNYFSNGFIGQQNLTDVSHKAYRIRPGGLVAIRFEPELPPHVTQALNPVGAVNIQGMRMT